MFTEPLNLDEMTEEELNMTSEALRILARYATARAAGLWAERYGFVGAKEASEMTCRKIREEFDALEEVSNGRE